MGRTTDTKDVILDAAERMFGKHGFDGVSLRSLTKRAGVNLASVHYHFGSKEAVVRAVFLRRVRPLNRRRLELLEAAARNGDPQVEDILTALFAPALRIAQDPERGRRFMQLGARFYSEPGKYLGSLFAEEFAEVSRRFEAAFRRALPDMPRDLLRRRIDFAVGVMVHTMLGYKSTLGACGSHRASTLDAMVRFVAAGMRAPAGMEAAASAPQVRENPLP